jgi:hypothetical protein
MRTRRSIEVVGSFGRSLNTLGNEKGESMTVVGAGAGCC